MKEYQIYNRKTNRIEPEISGNLDGLSFLYHTTPGKVITRLLIKKFVSNAYRKYVMSTMSIPKIGSFIRQYKIDTAEVKRPMDSFVSLNDFFIRELKPGARTIDLKSENLISPADSRLHVFDLSRKNSLPVKGYWYSLAELLGDEELAGEYADGWCFVYRLAPCDYHRFCYIDDGRQDEVRRIKGVLHSVNPIALSSVNSLLAANYRELTLMHTGNFGKVLHLEVGALLVGKVVQLHREKYEFKRGEEKGWFEFGGSTIVQLFKKNAIIPDQDILDHTANQIETLVRLGEKVGAAINRS